MSGAYVIECQTPDGKWVAFGVGPCAMGYGRGYIDAVLDGPTPRLAYRVIRQRDGKVIVSVPAVRSAGIGMVCGWPSWQQLARAGVRVLLQAADTAAQWRLDAEIARRLRHDVDDVQAVLARYGEVRP